MSGFSSPPGRGDTADSSLDELALSTSQPAQQSVARARSKTPLSYKSPNIRRQILDFDATPALRGTSPAKSMILETPAKPGSSPWRIKVTVEAEPNSDDHHPVSSTPSKPSVIRSRKMTVPLKDAGSSPVKRGVGRPRKSDATPAASAIKKRKGTPMRRPSVRLSGGKNDLEGDTADDKAAVAELPTPKKRGRPRKNPPEDDGRQETSAANNSNVKDQPAQSPLRVERQPLNNSISPDVHAQPQGETQQHEPLTSTSPSPALGPPEINSPPPPSPQHERQPPTPKDRRARPVPGRVSSAYNFESLTPLHVKHPTTKPVPQKNVPPRRFSREEAVGFVPDGWSKPIFSPIPARKANLVSYAAEQRRAQWPKNNPRRLEEWSGEKMNQTSPASSPRARVDQGTDEEKEDADMWRQMIPTRQDDASTEGRATPSPDSDDSDVSDGMEFTGHPIGEETMMQSEEFSMVSLGSLRELQSFVDGVQMDITEEEIRTPSRQVSMLSQAVPPDATLNDARHSSMLSQAVPPDATLNDARHSSKSPPSYTMLRSKSFSSPGQHLQSGGSYSRSLQISSPKIAGNTRASNTLQDKTSHAELEPQARLSTSESNSASTADRSFVSSGSSHPALSTNFAQSQMSPRRQPSGLADTSMSALQQDEARLPTPNSAEKASSDMILPPPPSHNDGFDYPTLRHSSTPTTVSPAKSMGEMSWQTKTPPSTNRGTPSASGEDEVDKSMEIDAAATPTSTKVLEKEARWQRAREEVSRTIQSAKADKVVVIESDDEDEEDDDIWQEEASREEPGQVDQPRPKEANSRSNIFSHVELPTPLRRAKVSRSWRHLSATDSLPEGSAKRKEGDSFTSIADERHGGLDANVAEISALFKSVADSKYQRDANVQPVSGADRRQRSGLFQQRNSSTDFDERRNISHHRIPYPGTRVTNNWNDVPEDMMSGRTARMPTINTSPNRVAERMGGESNISHQAAPQRSTLLQARPETLRSSQLKSSPLKRRLSIDSSEYPTREDSQIRTNDHNASFTDTNASMASDVRQLRNELKTARSAETSTAAHVGTRTIPTKMFSVDDTTEEDEGSFESSALLSITPKRPYKQLFQDASAQAQRPTKENHHHTLKSHRYSEITQHRATAKPVVSYPGLFSFVWSILPFTYTSPPHPTHPLLAHLPLLPRVEPWTRTHYRAMDSLYQQYKRNPDLFSTSHPNNTSLITPTLRPYLDIEISNWGYHVRLNPGLIILASLFTRLLVLRNIADYERGGAKIDMGECSPGPVGQLITDWEVVKRLFGVVAGEDLRADEERGKAIQREPDMLRWRYKRSVEWIWAKDLSDDEADGR